MYSGGSSTSYPSNNEGMTAMANASKESAIAQSNNNLLAILSQNAVMKLGILESSKNTQFQILAWLTERLDSHDTKLEIVVENARLALREEENRHDEAGDRHAERLRELEIEEIEARRPASISSGQYTV